MIIIITMWAIAVNWFAYRKGFYRFPKESLKTTALVTTKQLFITFGISYGIDSRVGVITPEISTFSLFISNFWILL